MKNLVWEYDALPHALIAGGTGGGKTYFLLTIIEALLQTNAELYILDPKNADLADLGTVMSNVYHTKEEMIDCVKDILKLNISYMLHEDFGHYKYTEHYYIGDVFVYTSQDKEKGVLLELKGKGCRQFESYLLAQERSWYDFFMDALVEGGVMKRLDLAINDRTGLLDIPELIEKCKNEECISKFRSFKNYGSGELVKHNEANKDGMGHTLYISSFTSEVYFCVYEKNYEQCSIISVVVIYFFQVQYSKRKLKKDLRCNEIIQDVYDGIEKYCKTNTTVQILKTPKTESSIRKVFLPKSVANMLVEWKAEQDEVKEVLGEEYIDYNLVMATTFGNPIGTGAIRGQLKKLIEEHNLPPVVFHSLRHSSVTYKLKLNGGDIKAVQGDSGHSQVDMVTDVYSHIIDEDRRRNAELFEEAFYEKKNLDPKMRDETATQTVDVPDDVDAELLAKVLANPEMKALLASLAKAMK